MVKAVKVADELIDADACTVTGGDDDDRRTQRARELLFDAAANAPVLTDAPLEARGSATTFIGISIHHHDV